MKPAAHVEAACDQLRIIGQKLRAHLCLEIPAKILFRQARDVVLLCGPTGSGKEKVAAVCHEAAQRALDRCGPLVEVNCANLSQGLFESELFGHRKGAFTGAEHAHGGLVARAENGTLVLDEVQALSSQDQARLLRFLGEREYRAVGDGTVRHSNALIILSSNRDLRAMVREGTFRRDLLDRAPAKLTVPPLHTRRQDIAELAQFFAQEAAAAAGASDHYGLTRRAQADVVAAITQAHEVSVRRLRELVRDIVFFAATDGLAAAIESPAILPTLERELGYRAEHRDAQDQQDVDDQFDKLVVQAKLQQVAERHHVSSETLQALCDSVQGLIGDMDDQPRSYRNVVERTNRLSKIALWLVSGAQTQAEFRRYFGRLSVEMPPKSVAHQIYYEVHPRSDGA